MCSHSLCYPQHSWEETPSNSTTWNCQTSGILATPPLDAARVYWMMGANWNWDRDGTHRELYFTDILFPSSKGQILPLGCNELCRDSATQTTAVSGAFRPCKCRGIPAGIPPVLGNKIKQKQEQSPNKLPCHWEVQEGHCKRTVQLEKRCHHVEKKCFAFSL